MAVDQRHGDRYSAGPVQPEGSVPLHDFRDYGVRVDRVGSDSVRLHRVQAC